MDQKIKELRKLISDYEGMLERNDMEELWHEIL
jgi:hypothetical protein